MEKVIGEIFKSGDKLFVTEEECSRYERKTAIENFLMTHGYEFYDGGMRKTDALQIRHHTFLVHGNRIRYTCHLEFRHNCIEFKLCNIEVFKTFYDGMFMDQF